MTSPHSRPPADHDPTADFVIMGSGIAGLYTAIRLSSAGRVVVLSKQDLTAGNTWFAQGGMAAAIAWDDSPDLHYRDTWEAGARFGDPEAISVLVNEAPLRIKELEEAGLEFDRRQGKLDLGREGAHCRNRVLHIGGDATGRGLEEALLSRAKRLTNINFIENAFVSRLLVREGRAAGVCYLKNGQSKTIFSGAVILASGGCGQLFRDTTNSAVLTGDGLALAYRAGAVLRDLEFFQFHPTVFFPPQGGPFLISEAVRGEGAYLINSEGDRFMKRYHPLGELGPRDAVSRAIICEQRLCEGQVYIDLRHLDPSFVRNRFPTIHQSCLHWGLDITRHPVPVSPAAHYLIGGIEVDLWGRTTLPNLYAVGEAASTGVHGANRLASNSLMEALVFGRRTAQAAVIDRGATFNPVKPCPSVDGPSPAGKARPPRDWRLPRNRLQQMMWEGAGVERSREKLMEVRQELASRDGLSDYRGESPEEAEYLNMLLIASLMTEAALAREESRGCHFRQDFPETDHRLDGHHFRFKHTGEGKIPSS